MARRTRDEWREICAESYASGMTVRAFAAAAGVNPNTLSWWRCQLRDELVFGGARFVEVSPATVRADADDRTVPLSMEVGELRLTFNALPPTDWLAELFARF